MRRIAIAANNENRGLTNIQEVVMGLCSINYQSQFEAAIDRLKNENRYRVFANLERDAARFPTATWRPDEDDGDEARTG